MKPRRLAFVEARVKIAAQMEYRGYSPL